MSTTEINPVNNAPVVPAAPKQKITTQVLAQIESLRGKQNLALPADYSASNALNAAWLVLQEVVDKDRKNIFRDGQLTGVVTQVSVANALLDMVIQGLNPAKKQGYFIVYGDKLIWQRSYFGDQALAQRVMPGIEFYSAVVRQGDDFAFETLRGRTVVTKHGQKLEDRDKPIVAAYAGVVRTDTGEDLGCSLMTIDRIKKSWGMSKTAHFETSTHNKFPEEMALRTVTRHRCKPIYNTSTDVLLKEALQRQALDGAEGEMADEVAANANQGAPLALSTPAYVEPAPAAPSEPVEMTDEAPPGEEEQLF